MTWFSFQVFRMTYDSVAYRLFVFCDRVCLIIIGFHMKWSVATGKRPKGFDLSCFFV